MRGLNSNWRKRIFLLLLAILPQLLSLAGLAGLFWMLRLKEVFTVDIVPQVEEGKIILHFDLTEMDRPKIEVGSIIHGTFSDRANRTSAEFQAKVINIQKFTSSAGIAWKIRAEIHPIKNSRLALFAKSLDSQPILLTMWSRTRRALTVLLTRDDNSKKGLQSVMGGVKMGNAP
jgi:hypothetical protein